MMNEKKKNITSSPSSSGQSTAPLVNVSNQISSHCENSAQTLSQITDAEIQKHAGHTKVVDEDKHIPVKINLNRFTSKILRDILKNSKPVTHDLIGAKKSDTMYGAAHSSVQRDSCDQKSVTGNELNVSKLNNVMPEIKENVSTTSQSAFDINSVLLSDQIRELLGDPELSNTSNANEHIVATFSFENNDAEIKDAHEQESKPCSKIVCIPFHYKKTSKRNKNNLCWTRPFLVCNISDMIQPEVAKGIVDLNHKTLVINIDPSRNMKTHRRNRLTYKVQYRMSLKSKIYPDKSVKTNEVVRQLKRKPALPITPVTYEYDNFLSYSEIMSKRIKLSLTQRPLDFLIPISATLGNCGYTEECVAERITFEELTLRTHESCIDNSINSKTIAEKEMEVDKQKQRKRYSTENIPCENKRTRMPKIEYHDIRNKNEELLHSMRIRKDFLKTNDDRIITSRNKPNGTIQKCQKDVNLSKRVNGDLTPNANFSREILSLTKNIPWDFALRTCQTVMPVTVELDKDGMSKSSKKFTNEITIPEVVDKEEDDVLQAPNVFETSANDHSDCTMITVSETNVMENDVGEIVKEEECNTVSNENVISISDIEVDDYNSEIDVEACSDDEFLYPLPKEGSIWQITTDPSGAVIYENIRPGDTDVESANEESESEDKQVKNQLTYKDNQDDEYPILDTIKTLDSDAETVKYEEESSAESDVELIVIDEEIITISELETELCDEKNSLIIDLPNKEKKPTFETSFYDDEDTVELNIESLSNIKKHEELDSGAEIVDKGQTVDTDVQSNPPKEEISMEMQAESHLYNQEQTIKSDCKMNNNNEIHDNPAEGTKINNNSEHDKLVNSSPIRNQNELNFSIYPENQNVIKSNTPLIRRTSATSFEICFTDFQQTTPPNHKPEVGLENAMKETNIINDVSSYVQKKEGKIIILEDKIVQFNVSAENQKNIDYHSRGMVIQNTTEQTEGQSVTKNYHQPLTTVPQQQVTRETQQSLIKQVHQPDTREFPQLVSTRARQPVIEESQQPVPRKPQESVTTEPQLPVTIATSGILQTIVNQNTSTYPVPMIASSVIIQKVTETQIPPVPLQVAGVPATISYMSGYTQNYNEMHQILNSQIPSISNVQTTQRSETSEMHQILLTGNNCGTGPQSNKEKRSQPPVQNYNLPNPYTAQNVQHHQNGSIAGGYHGEAIKIISLSDKDIRVRQYNEQQVSHIPSQENNMVKQNLYQNPGAQHINQTSMLPNNYPRPIESARSVMTVNQHTENTVAQMPYQAHNMIPQYSNQHFGIPQNRQMPNNQTVQRGQYQPREYASYKEMNVPRMDLPRDSMVAQQNNQTQMITNHQPIPEPTRNELIHSTQSVPMLPMSNNGGTMGANGINIKQNPSIQHVNNPYAVLPYRNENSLRSRNAPVQHNSAAIINNNKDNIHSYRPSVQTHPSYLPPPYPGRMQYNTQPLPNNNMKDSSPSLENIHQDCVNTSNFYRHIMMQQQNQLQAMNMKIEELHVALKKQTPNTPRRGRKKKDDEAISPEVPNYSQQRFPENAGQLIQSTRVPSEDHGLTSRSHLARNDFQQAGPVPYIPSEEHRVAYLNHLARNNSQQVSSVPYVPSQENYLKPLNQRPVMDSQQVFPVPRVPPKEHYVKYQNRPVLKESQEMSSTSLVSSEERSSKYPNRALGIDSQQVRPITRTHFEEQNLKYTNRPSGMNSQHVRPVSFSEFEKQYLNYINSLPVQPGTQERYPLTSGQSAGSVQNVIPPRSKNAYYPMLEAPGSQNVSMVHPSVPLGTPFPSASRHQPQESQPLSIYKRPVRNDHAIKLQNLHADKMHAEGKFPDASQSLNNDLFKIAKLCKRDNNSAAQSNSSVNQLSNENGPINLSLRDKNGRKKQDNNVSDQATSGATGRKQYYETESEYMELEALRKHMQKKQGAAPRNESRDSGYLGSPREGGSYF